MVELIFWIVMGLILIGTVIAIPRAIRADRKTAETIESRFEYLRTCKNRAELSTSSDALALLFKEMYILMNDELITRELSMEYMAIRVYIQGKYDGLGKISKKR